MKFGQVDKFYRHETPIGEYHHGAEKPKAQLYKPHHVPENEYEALMVTLPGDHPEMSETEREQDWEMFQHKISKAGLTERETVVVNCMVFGGMSLSQTAIVIAQAEGLSKAPPKMSVSRWRDRAYQKLRNVFQENDND